MCEPAASGVPMMGLPQTRRHSPDFLSHLHDPYISVASKAVDFVHGARVVYYWFSAQNIGCTVPAGKATSSARYYIRVCLFFPLPAYGALFWTDST